MAVGLVVAVACGSEDTPRVCTGPCECEVESDCADPHATCNAEACECVAGYTQQAGACAWTGVIADPGFSTAGTWGTTEFAVIRPDTMAPELRDPGVGLFFGGVMPSCGERETGLDRIDQLVTMPRLSRAELLVTELTLRQGTEDTHPSNGNAIGLGGVWQKFYPDYYPAWSRQRRCLGAAAYAPDSSTGPGVERPFEIMHDEFRVCFETSRLELDHVEILPAAPGECAAPGSVLNGDAEADTGWHFIGENASTAGYAPGIGVAGSRGIGFHLDRRCDYAGARVALSIPDVASPALRFHGRIPPGALARLSIDDATTVLAGTGTLDDTRVCLPKTLRGAATELSIQLFAQNPNGSACTDVVAHDAVFDQLAVIDDPTCGTNAIADGGFESPAETFGLAPFATASARKVRDPALAHAGTAALEMSRTVTCAGVSWHMPFVAPTATSGTNAIAYYYKGTGGVHLAPEPDAATYDGQWHRVVQCMGDSLAGFPRRFELGIFDPAPVTCGQVVPSAAIYIDDVQLVDEPSCRI
ncbi:MAG: hypothetical protein WKG01_06190 [Kofleriaceae bacterium]